jgi:hypothetical protein
MVAGYPDLDVGSPEKWAKAREVQESQGTSFLFRPWHFLSPFTAPIIIIALKRV